MLKNIGPAEFRTRMDAQFNAFVAVVAGHLGVEHLTGEQALETAYLEIPGNRVAPNRGLICHIG